MKKAILLLSFLGILTQPSLAQPWVDPVNTGFSTGAAVPIYVAPSQCAPACPQQTYTPPPQIYTKPAPEKTGGAAPISQPVRGYW